jgi:hypothetical protein
MFKRIMVELEDGTILDIADLHQKEYEAFLNLALKINDTYRSLILEGAFFINEKDESQSI